MGEADVNGHCAVQQSLLRPPTRHPGFDDSVLSFPPSRPAGIPVP